MAQQLTVKAYLRRLDLPEEIRRFSLDLDVSTSYEYLLAKIVSVFPGLGNKKIILYWKDVDNDMIAFSSDDELIEALRSVTDGMFRVYVIEKSTAAPAAPTGGQNEVLHVGITCDGCEGPVRGTRYKCTVCDDYDLCSQCKSTGLHGQHEMRTIAEPHLPWMHAGPFGGFGILGHPPPPPPPPMVPPPPFGAQPPPPPPPPGCVPPCPPMFGLDFGMLGDARKMQRRAWKRWYKETYGHDHHRRCKKEKKEMKKQQKEKDKENKGKDESEGCLKRSSSSSSDSEAEASPTGEYLKSVGHSVAAMLDPLGIDVEVDVEHHGQRRRCHRGPWGPWFGGRGGMRGWHCGPWGARGRGGCPWRGGWAGWGAGPSTTQPVATSTTATPANQQQPGESAPRHDPDTNSETGEMASNWGAAGLEQGWTLVNNGSPPDVEGATVGVQQMTVTDGASESVPLISLTAATPVDPKIAEAVESMMSMGYSNEGGWLTQLLIAHNGDIGRALDAIHAKK